MTLEDGSPFRLYPEQRLMLADYFGGTTETLILVPKKNGKSTLLSALALFHLAFTADAECVIAAASRDQAGIMLRQARGFIRRSEWLSQRMRLKQREIVSLVDEGRIRILAADADTADGVIPTLAIVDELHRHKSTELYGVFRDGLGPRNGQMVTISTAGEHENTPLGQMRRVGYEMPGFRRDGTHRWVRSPSGEYAMHEWALDETDDRTDMAVVKRANPAPWQTENALRRRYDSPSMRANPWQWARFACGVWMSPQGQGVAPNEWDALRDVTLVRAPGQCFGFLDLGWKIDMTGLGVLNWESHERRTVHGPKALAPPVDEGDIVESLLGLQEEFEPVGWVYDPNAGGQQMAQLLEKGEHPKQVERGIGPISFIEHSQADSAMSLAATRFDEAVRNEWLVHDGDPELRRHVLNAVRRGLSGERYRYDRPGDAKGERRALFPIDLLTGLLMANSVAVGEMDKPTRTNQAVFL